MSTNYLRKLTDNEQKVLYGLVRFPTCNDKQLAAIFDMKDSTLTSVKKRLAKNSYFRELYIPMLNRMGCEILGVIFTQFNPVIQLEDRVVKSRKSIEKNFEIFLSIGALEQGFSLSFSEDYTTFARINEDRTEFFGNAKLIDKEYPNEVIFPFDISKIHRFFNYEQILRQNFTFNFEKYALNIESDEENRNNNQILKEKVQNSADMAFPANWFQNMNQIKLTEKEKLVIATLIGNPSLTMQEIGEKVELSRHTVARMKKRFFKLDLIRKIVIPDLRKMGFNLLVFYHFQFSPNRPIDNSLIKLLNNSSTIFFASRKYQAVIISAYPEYAAYKEDKMRIFSHLKENRYLNYTPSPRKYVLDQMQYLKDFELEPITEKILKMME